MGSQKPELTKECTNKTYLKIDNDNSSPILEASKGKVASWSYLQTVQDEKNDQLITALTYQVMLNQEAQNIFILFQKLKYLVPRHSTRSAALQCFCARSISVSGNASCLHLKFSVYYNLANNVRQTHTQTHRYYLPIKNSIL